MVVAGLKVPQESEGAQDQVTPALEGSLETLAATLAVAPTWREAGGADQKTIWT